MKRLKIINRKRFFLNIVIPSFLTQALFVILIFAFVIPFFEHNLIEAKKEMIKEIVYTSISIAEKYNKDAKEGKISTELAKKLTIEAISNIRYGTQNKDYIWITDEIPNMIMHPYRKELIGKNVERFTDPEGKEMFSEMVKTVKQTNEGYVFYMWQWMDDSLRIVPKISFVKVFKEWKWIFGTGVYYEDVKESISLVVNTVMWISFGIFIIVSFLLYIIGKQNLRAERERHIAEIGLKESHEKYKALVEASNDGTLMFVNNRCIYKNNKIIEFLGQSSCENLTPNFFGLIDNELREDILRINDFLESKEESLRLETRIKSDKGFKDILLSYSRILINNREQTTTDLRLIDAKNRDDILSTPAVIVIIKDLSAAHQENIADIILSDIFMQLSERLNIGVFRVQPSKKGKITESNKVFLKILGYNSIEDLSGINLYDIFENPLTQNEFYTLIKSKKIVKDYKVRVRTNNKHIIDLTISAYVNENNEGVIESIDGIVNDCTEFVKAEEQKERFLSQLLYSASIWDLPVGNIPLKVIPECSPDISILKAIELMDFYQSDYLTMKIVPSHDNTTGNSLFFLLTREELYSRIIKSSGQTNQSIVNCIENDYPIMNAESSVIDCLIEMHKKSGNFVCIKDNQELKALSFKDILPLIKGSTSFLERELKEAETISKLNSIHSQLPFIIRNFVGIGSEIQIITNTITKVSDLIANSIIPMAINQCGIPPCKFSFIALGSEGRQEQGLSTDQDNAIIIEDFNIETSTKNPADSQQINNYFLKFGKLINELLNETGYKFCTGNIMSGNEKWNKPLSVWKQYFLNWISNPEPQNLVDSFIFFDFRNIYGEKHLAENLKTYINNLLVNNPSFLSQAAITTSNYKLPLGIFGKIQTETILEHHDSFNLKNAIRLVVNIIRLYAMKNFLNETNTLDRLKKLYELNLIQYSFYSELKYSYEYLMKLQFKFQIRSINLGFEADNYLNLSLLTPTELTLLKTVLSSITTFQSKIKYDFGINI